ncbi:hypothetical protein Acr_26g0007950 [Actinidia rufa]|uniref:Transmembrane protein n=1 Tax=Actinidia rufa TaxID=165716 RepID=A0A7J0H3D6_9ERIC|nr:hypothetical protein Acr_26g0007950 [Actinidia rufa]
MLLRHHATIIVNSQSDLRSTTLLYVDLTAIWLCLQRRRGPRCYPALLYKLRRRIRYPTFPYFLRIQTGHRDSHILSLIFQTLLTQVNKYDGKWKKQWFGAGIFYEGSEEVPVDVFKKIEQRKVLSNLEKAGLLSKAEELGLTLSSIEKLGVFSKAEELGLLSLLEKAASFSPSALASAALPILVAAILAIVLIPDDSAALVAVQAVIAGALGVGAAGLLVGSVVLGGLQEAD